MQDFTEGNITKQVIDFTLPIMLGNVLMSVYGIINLIWVGRLLGHKAVAAVAASLPIIMLMPAFLIGLGMATNVLIAQAFGRKDTAMLKKILSNSFFSSVLFCLLISLLGLLFRRQLLEWVHAPAEIQEMALSYLTIMMATMVFQFYVNWMNGMLRGLGDATTVVKILILLAVFNVVFVPLFILGIGPLPPLGVAGAAWGTGLAAVVTCVIGYVYLLRFNPYINMRNWDYSLDWHIIKEVFVIGVPASLQMIVVSVAGVIIVALVNRYGTAVTAAFGIGMQVDMLATIPFISISMAATTIAGQNLGARKLERVYETLRTAVYFGLAIGLLCTAVLLIFPEQIGGIFLKESAENVQVLHLVRDYYRWIAFIFPCFAVIFAIQGVLRSAGDTMALLALSFIAMVMIRIPLAYGLAGLVGFKQDGIWMAMLSSSALAVGLNWLYYRKGPWKKKRLLGNPSPPASTK
ncbi:MAG TPA: MATE family efflux transporter [Smithellaceae bacterium]|nr:MATE family efflux transporter [Smithella sp.]HQP23960.1 MATE family efflux transporter [Smithellaceae bacterium]